MHELIASRFMEEFLLARPGHRNGVSIGRCRYEELAASVAQDQCPPWLLPAVARAWPDLLPPAGPVGGWVLVRPVSPYGYARASYELNLGCNYDCPMCYLGVKQFSGLDWADRVTLLRAMAEAGVLFLQLTGGEPLIDKFFPDTYRLAFELGMMISVSTNGSRLSSAKILTLLTEVFTGCNAGHTFFHADPHGRVSICKIGRDEQISLIDEGVAGLARLRAIADSLLLRTGGCAGCQLSGACMVCRPLAKRYQQARAPLHTYCQHGQRGEEVRNATGSRANPALPTRGGAPATRR